MKAIRIGTGAGFSGDRIEPAVELAEKGDLDYLIFECLAERTIALAQQAKMKDPAQGYDPLLAERMQAVLPDCRAKGIRIITNMGAANPVAAAEKVREIARSLGLSGIRIAAVSRRRRSGDGARRRLPTRRDRRAGQHARQPARLGQRLPRRGAHRGGAGRRCRHRHHRSCGRSGDVPGPPDPRVRLVDGGLDPARPGHGRRPPARVRRADHRRLLRRSWLQGRPRPCASWLPPGGGGGGRDRGDHQGAGLRRKGDRRNLQGAAALRGARPCPLLPARRRGRLLGRDGQRDRARTGSGSRAATEGPEPAA